MKDPISCTDTYRIYNIFHLSLKKYTIYYLISIDINYYLISVEMHFYT